MRVITPELAASMHAEVLRQASILEGMTADARYSTIDSSLWFIDPDVARAVAEAWRVVCAVGRPVDVDVLRPVLRRVRRARCLDGVRSRVQRRRGEVQPRPPIGQALRTLGYAPVLGQPYRGAWSKRIGYELLVFVPGNRGRPGEISRWFIARDGSRSCWAGRPVERVTVDVLMGLENALMEKSPMGVQGEWP